MAIRTTKRRHWCRSGVFIVNFEHISHIVSFEQKLSRQRNRLRWISEKYSEPCQTSKKECFVGTGNANKELHLRYLTGVWISLSLLKFGKLMLPLSKEGPTIFLLNTGIVFFSKTVSNGEPIEATSSCSRIQ